MLARSVWVAVALAGLLLGSGVVAAQSTDQSTSGRLLFVKDGDLWVWQAGSAFQLGSGGTWSQPSWAPDGASLAYVYLGTNFADIFVTDDRGEHQTRLTDSQSTILENNDWNMRPAWSPDGSTIAYVSDRTSMLPLLWLIGPDGTGRRQVNIGGIQQEAIDSLAWSPDGSEIAFTAFNPPASQIAVVTLGTGARQAGRVVTDTPGGALDPAWSPDGNWLAYAGRSGPTMEIYVTHPDGSGRQQVTRDGFLARSPAWSPDGKHLAYLSTRTGFFELWMVDVETDPAGELKVSAPRQLTRDLHVDGVSGLSWGP